MESASHARIDPVTVEGLDDVFVSPDVPAPDTVVQTPARPFQNATHLLKSLQEAPPLQSVSPVLESEAQQSTERALATAKAIARCLDVRSEAVIEHHIVSKPPKNKKKKKTVEEWRIKWSPKKDDKAGSSELVSVDLPGYSHERGLFDHVSELLRQNSQLIAKLEAATYRIGYLESELESLRNQAGYSDCDAQIAELPVPKPAIRAISERRQSSSRVSTPDCKFSSAFDFWDEEPVVNESNVPFKKLEEEPLQVEAVTKPVGEETGMSNAPNSLNSRSTIGFFNWMPPRA